jgi:hypothetical protein
MSNQAELSKKSDRTEIEKKLEKIHHGFAQTVAGLPLKDLEQNLLMYAKHNEDTQHALRNSKEIKEAQEQLKELKAPYSDMLKALKLKMSYIHILMKEQAGEPSEEEKE